MLHVILIYSGLDLALAKQEKHINQGCECHDVDSYSCYDQHFRATACDSITEHIGGQKQLSVILHNHLWWQLYILQIGLKIIITLLYAQSNVFQGDNRGAIMKSLNISQMYFTSLM